MDIEQLIRDGQVYLLRQKLKHQRLEAATERLKNSLHNITVINPAFNEENKEPVRDMKKVWANHYKDDPCIAGFQFKREYK